MQIKRFRFKNIIIVLSVIVFVGLLFFSNKLQNGGYQVDYLYKCMGIPVISEGKLKKITEKNIEIENIVNFQGELTAYDQEKKTIYIPCFVEENTDINDIKGVLQSNYPGYVLYFIEDTAFEDFCTAIASGHEFQLAVVNDEGSYMIYQVVFTTLPVVEIHGRYKNTDEREREIYSGEITVWSAEKEGLVVRNSGLEWKLRGNTALEFPKKSYKLSLKNKKKKSENVSLLGLEEDDDYILNPMWMDDLKVREKLAITLWNDIAEQKSSSIRMSDAEYCEVVINGSYKGIYLLQERIEKKTLKLADEDILFKGSGLDVTEESVPQDIFEVIYSPLDKTTTYAVMENFLSNKDFSAVDKESWVDNQLFMQLGHMIDNRRYKNMYYVVKRSNGQEMINFLPWDTDMSFGVSWNNGFSYQPESVEKIAYRIENDAIVAQYPELETMQKERWKELRSEFFSQQHILEIIDSNFKKLDSSGVLERDYQVFGENAWGGSDTRENLELYIIKRLEILDEKYSLN